MGASIDSKLRWFERGAKALELQAPEFLGANSTSGAVYCCPLCDGPFNRDAVESGALTAEHVPPKSVEGRELLLTCRACNNLAGTALDAHAASREDVALIAEGRLRKSLKVQIQRGEHRIPARLSPTPNERRLDVVAKVNNPRTLAAFQAEGLRANDTIRVQFTGARYSELGANISWLRAGFLALFATFGYRFGLDPALAPVKKQIREFRNRSIYCS